MELFQALYPIFLSLMQLQELVDDYEEVMEVTNMARRTAAILLLEPQLNVNYEVVKQATY